MLAPKNTSRASLQDDRKKIKTESGVWIPASYKSDRYSRWKERSKFAQMNEEADDNGEGDERSTRKREFIAEIMHHGLFRFLFPV